MLNGNMHSPMRSWPMTDWDHDDHEKGAYHEAGHAAVLWTFGVPPPSSQARTGTEITVRFAFKRNGEILAAPRVTYASAGALPDTRATYVNAIKAALSRCTPMSFSEGLAAVIVGHPFAIRFVDDRTGLSQ